MTTAFAKRLNYTSVNEDWRAEREALQIGPNDSVLCVTGSGQRSLVLLEDDPAKIVSVDMNPCQGHLLELRRAAMRAMRVKELHAFVGLRASEDRLVQLQRLAPALPCDAREFWFENQDAVERGVLYQGRWERHHLNLARIAQMLRGRAIRRLFSIRDLDEQRAFVRRTWDRRWWRLVVRMLCSPWLARVLLRDPAFYAHVGEDLDVGRYIYDRMLRSMDRHLARESFMLSLLLRGRLDEDDLPPDLAPRSYDRIRARLARIENRTADVVAFMEAAPRASFTRFSLSDVPSYLDAQGFARLVRAMARAAAPGARFCIRQFLTDHPMPVAEASLIEREPQLEARLADEDRAFAYRFLVGTVRS